MNGQHTPGPWTHQADSTFSTLGDRRLVGANLISPGIVFGGLGPETDANARLIAAAPELLAALKLAEPIVALAYGRNPQYPSNSHALTNVRDAIAKAEGATE
jgi:hypothetical protein